MFSYCLELYGILWDLQQVFLDHTRTIQQGWTILADSSYQPRSSDNLTMQKL